MNVLGFFWAGWVLYGLLSGLYSSWLAFLAGGSLVGAVILLSRHLYDLLQQVYEREAIRREIRQDDSIFLRNVRELWARYPQLAEALKIPTLSPQRQRVLSLSTSSHVRTLK